MLLLGLTILAANLHYSIGLLLLSVCHLITLLSLKILKSCFLQETPLPPSLQIFPLPSSSSSSSSRSVPAASSDALPSSSVTTFNFEDHDPPTKDEEVTGRGGGGGTNHSSRGRTVNDEAATRTRDGSKRGSDSHSLSQNHLCHEQAGDRKETTNDRIEEKFVTNGTATSGMDNAFAPRKSKDKKVRFASHSTSHMTELESVQSSVDILLQYKLPKARQRTNVVTWSPIWRLHHKRRRSDNGFLLISGSHFCHSLFSCHST